MKSKLFSGFFFFTLLFSVCEKTSAQSPAWIWAKALGGAAGGAAVNSIVVDRAKSADVYSTGYFWGTVDFDPGINTFNLTSTGVNAMFISKLDGSGHFKWAVSVDVTDQFRDYPYLLAVNASGTTEVYITGTYFGTVDFDPGLETFNLTSAEYGDMFICKLDGDGNFIWAKSLGGTGQSSVNSIAIDPSGNGDICTIGSFRGTVDFNPGSDTFNLASGNYNGIFIIKLDSSGHFVWAKAVEGEFEDFGKSIAIDPGNGDVYSTGRFRGTVDFNPGADSFKLTSYFGACSQQPFHEYICGDMFISKLDSSGTFVWAKSLSSGAEGSEGYSIAIDPEGSGNIYITGGFEGTVDFDPGSDTFNLTSVGGEDIFISKFNATGNLIWAKSMGGTGWDRGLSLVIDIAGSGDIYTTSEFYGTVDFNPGLETFNITSNPAGCCQPSFGTFSVGEMVISRFDSSGNFVWATAVDGTNGEDRYPIALTHAGQVYVAGTFQTPSISFGSDTLLNAGSTVSTVFIAKLYTAFTTSIDRIVNQQINVYPNPTSDKLTVEFEGDEFFNVEISFFNCLGEIVFSNPVENIPHQKTIDISSLTTGIYFMELNIDGNRVVRKVLKE